MYNQCVIISIDLHKCKSCNIRNIQMQYLSPEEGGGYTNFEPKSKRFSRNVSLNNRYAYRVTTFDAFAFTI